MAPKLAFALHPDVTRHVFDQVTLNRIHAVTDVISAVPLFLLSKSELEAGLAEAEILVTGWGCPMLSPEILQAAPHLKLIAHAAGTVKLTIDPIAYARGIRVTHAAEANAVPVAEFTLAAILFANKRAFAFRELYRQDHSRGTSRRLEDAAIGNFRRTVGIIGASRIGRRLIALLKPFDLSVLLYDPFVSEGEAKALGVELVELNTLVARSDVVSLHAPSLPSTRHMIGAAQFALMQDGAVFINTARGALVDEGAMIAELVSGRISAVIDVTEPEIPEDTSPLYDLPNVFLTPHIAGAIGTERNRLGMMIADEIERYVRGDELRFELAPELLERTA